MENGRSEDPIRSMIEAAFRESQKKLEIVQASAQRRLDRERKLQAQLKGMTVEMESLRQQLREKDDQVKETRKRAREDRDEVERRVTQVREAVHELHYLVADKEK